MEGGGGRLARGEEKESGIGRPRLGAKNWSTKRSQGERRRDRESAFLVILMLA